jgi:DNA-binding SARP family transcriptional activator
VEIRLLGPIELDRDGKRVELNRQLRVLLAILVLARGQAVSHSRLMALLWGDKGSNVAEATLRSHVSHLRRALGASKARDHSDLALVADGGYVLRVPEEAVDLFRFERLAEQGSLAHKAGDATLAATTMCAALELWRGPAFGDLADRSFTLHESIRLHGLRRAAQVTLYEAELVLGRHAEITGQLEALVAEQPDDEALRRLLAVALYRDGFPGRAAETCADGIRLLYECGLESVRLQALQRDILRNAPSLEWLQPASERAAAEAAGAQPFQLPFDLSDFVGRLSEITTLRELLAPGGKAVPIVCIDGPPGVGKSALAIHVAHGLAHEYPDGQFYANLRGAEAQRLESLDVLGQFLRALGVQDPLTLSNTELAAARLRSELTGRRALIVLDNAASPGQIRPLIPGSPTCAVLVTSRVPLPSIEGIRSVALDVLPESDSLALLTTLSGAGRAAHDRASAEAVVRRCGQLPLALRIAGARLSARPAWTLADMAARLVDESQLLNELEAGDLAVRTSFQLSYRELGAASAKMFRLMSLANGPDTTLNAMAAALQISTREADVLLSELVNDQLIEELEPNRYRFHDLLRVFARERSELEDTNEERELAIIHYLNFYLSTTHGTFTILRPGAHLPEGITDGGGGGLVFRNERDALAWLEAERPNLVAAVELAATAPSVPHFVASSLGHVLFAFFDRVSYWRQDWRKVCETVLDAARRHNDRQTEARTLNTLGIIHRSFGSLAEALDCLGQSLSIWMDLGDRRGEMTALANYGNALAQAGMADRAVESLRRSLTICRDLGDRFNEAATNVNLAEALIELGAYGSASESLQCALDLAMDLGNEMLVANALAGLGEICNREGVHDRAVPYLQRGVDIARALGDPSLLGSLLAGLGDANRGQGLNDSALIYYRESLDLAELVGDTSYLSRAREGLRLVTPS